VGASITQRYRHLVLAGLLRRGRLASRGHSCCQRTRLPYGIIQIGPTILFMRIVLWSWLVMGDGDGVCPECSPPASRLDRQRPQPLLMARELTTPMPVILIGIIGGTIAYKIVLLLRLSVAWAVTEAWVQGEIAGESRSSYGSHTMLRSQRAETTIHSRHHKRCRRNRLKLYGSSPCSMRWVGQCDRDRLCRLARSPK